jgi:Domain of unknown function (DUF4833)
MPKLQKRAAHLSFIGGAIALLILPSIRTYAVTLNSIFLITKSDNGNQVHYGVQTNPDCSLKTPKPVYPYWKLANGRLEYLLALEVPAFGIASQSMSGNKVVIEVNGFKSRGIFKPIMMQSTRLNNQGCQISAFTKINGETTQLQQIHIDLTRNGLFGVGGTVHSITFYGAGKKQEKIVCKSNCSF